MPQMNDKLIAQIKKLKILLIAMTIIQFSSIIMMIANVPLWTKIERKYDVNTINFILQLSLAITFIWFIWKKMPGNRKQKTNHTLMILFVGFIGMWLWIPNRRELKRLREGEDFQKINGAR